jgi:hypothetical protein
MRDDRGAVTTDVLPAEDRIERYTGELVTYVRSLLHG